MSTRGLQAVNARCEASPVANVETQSPRFRINDHIIAKATLMGNMEEKAAIIER
jgi:hypothetical protein